VRVFRLILIRHTSFFSATSCCCLLLALTLVLPGYLRAEEGGGAKKTEKKEKEVEVPAVVVKPPPLQQLWARAQDLLKYDETEKAAHALYLVHYYYPDDEKGESALWQAATMEKELARSAGTPDWDKVLDLFRRYITYYPKSPRAAEANLELGKIYQAMHFYPEAQSYFKLFLENYPNSPLAPQAMCYYRDFLIRAGYKDEAAKTFQTWQQSTECPVRLVSEVGAGMLKSLQGDYQGALATYQNILTGTPNYPVLDPEILHYAGIANLRLGNVAAGREQLYHYLTLAGDTGDRAEALVELAESYFQAGEYPIAQKLYGQIKSENGSNERAVLISNLRLAQILDTPGSTPAKWRSNHEASDHEGDKPYLAVIEKLGNDPIAQDARFLLFKRYQARGQIDKAYEVGGKFLRSAEPAAADTPRGKQVGQILLGLVEELLKQKKYQEICDLYTKENRHFKDYPSGKLQAMVGQAMEALNLNEPAAALYYLALKWPMSDQEKADLFFRRAHVYLAMKDYAALDRLLTYLRKTHDGNPEPGEIDYYGAKLSEARGQIDQAHDQYVQALSTPTFKEKKVETAKEALDLMVRSDRLDQALAILKQGVAGGWISPEVQQGWFLRIGNGWRGKDEWAKAKEAYRQGLAKGLPVKGDAAQQIHLYQGDVLFALGDQKGGLSQYREASQGDNPQWKQLAVERLTQHDLDTEMAAMKKGSAK
jgi:tetratricopeptide (TPR) repeat protein